MLHDIKLGFQLLKYGYKLKTNLLMLLLFLAIGTAVEIVSKGSNVIGGFYYLLTGLFVYQLIISMDISEYVQTSPLKRKLQITIPIVSSSIVYFVLYVLLLIERIVLIKMMPEMEGQLLNSFIMIMIYLFFASAYQGLCYKFFASSTIGFVVLVMGITTVQSIMIRKSGVFVLVELGFAKIALICFGLLVLGIVLEYVLSAALYKKPLSKIAFSGFMKDMK